MQASSGPANSAQLGPFKKKCLILAILETDGRTQATAALGRVVIDLAEFAAVDRQETRAFMVSCNKQVHAAVGDPQLLVTIRWGDRVHHLSLLHAAVSHAPCTHLQGQLAGLQRFVCCIH